MLSIKKIVSPMIKSVLIISATLLATSTFADNSQQSVQLAQLTDGFNAETTYMMSCFPVTALVLLARLKLALVMQKLGDHAWKKVWTL